MFEHDCGCVVSSLYMALTLLNLVGEAVFFFKEMTNTVLDMA